MQNADPTAAGCLTSTSAVAALPSLASSVLLSPSPCAGWHKRNSNPAAAQADPSFLIISLLIEGDSEIGCQDGGCVFDPLAPERTVSSFQMADECLAVT